MNRAFCLLKKVAQIKVYVHAFQRVVGVQRAGNPCRKFVYTLCRAVDLPPGTVNRFAEESVPGSAPCRTPQSAKYLKLWHKVFNNSVITNKSKGAIHKKKR